MTASASASAADARAAVPAPRSQRLLAELRRSALFRSVVPLEAELGWPVPMLRGTADVPRVYLTVVAFRTRPRQGGKGGGLEVLPPFAHLTVGWPAGEVAAFADHRFESPWPGPVDVQRAVGAFPHPGLPRDAASYRQARTTAFGFYDELCEALAAGRVLPGAWWGRFADCLAPLLEPGLVPFYRVLGPKFLARILPADPEPESVPASTAASAPALAQEESR
ncbi:MAG TPA: hypothetical protein VIU15_43060 [Streptomyces sp.]